MLECVIDTFVTSDKVTIINTRFREAFSALRLLSSSLPGGWSLDNEFLGWCWGVYQSLIVVAAEVVTVDGITEKSV
jgi:hypothetical protein